MTRSDRSGAIAAYFHQIWPVPLVGPVNVCPLSRSFAQVMARQLHLDSTLLPSTTWFRRGGFGRKQQIFVHEQFAQVADRFDGLFLGFDRREAVPQFAPRVRPVNPHRLSEVAARRFQRREPSRPRRVFDNEGRNNREVVHQRAYSLERLPVKVSRNPLGGPDATAAP